MPRKKVQHMQAEEQLGRKGLSSNALNLTHQSVNLQRLASFTEYNAGSTHPARCHMPRTEANDQKLDLVPSRALSCIGT